MTRFHILHSLFLVLYFVFLVPACKEPQVNTTHAAARPKLPQTTTAIQFEHCARVDPAAAKKVQPITLAGVKLSVQGAALRFSGKPASTGRLVLGVLGDTRAASPDTLARLGPLSRRFKQAGAAAVVVLGGVAPTYDGVREVLARLREGGLPVLALPGDRASRSGFSGAVENLGAGVVDLIRVRAVVHPAASLVGLPGYYRAHHLLAGPQGCSYDGADLTRLAALAAGLPGPRVLLSHGPPRGSGPTAVDRAFGGVNVGDPLMGELMRRGKLTVVLSAHVHESAGRATTLSGDPVAQGAWSPTLVLNVGAADATPHQDLRGAWSTGTAALVEVEARRARFRMVELSRLTASPPSESGPSR